MFDTAVIRARPLTPARLAVIAVGALGDIADTVGEIGNAREYATESRVRIVDQVAWIEVVPPRIANDETVLRNGRHRLAIGKEQPGYYNQVRDDAR